jgi:hypothetical protein
MLDLICNINIDKEKRVTAINNLLVLAYERAGAEEIFKERGISKIIKLLKMEQNDEVICSAIRIISELCKNDINHIEFIMKDVGLSWYIEIMNSKIPERVNAGQYCLQVSALISNIYNKLLT